MLYGACLQIFGAYAGIRVRSNIVNLVFQLLYLGLHVLVHNLVSCQQVFQGRRNFLLLLNSCTSELDYDRVFVRLYLRGVQDVLVRELSVCELVGEERPVKEPVQGPWLCEIYVVAIRTLSWVNSYEIASP